MADMSIDEQIAYWTKKADEAQKSGNLEAMQEYDKEIKRLQDIKFEMLSRAVQEEPKTR